MRHAVIAPLLFATLLLVGCSRQGPVRAIEAIGTAVAQHDTSEFERLVDVPAVSEKWGKDMVSALAANGVDLSVWERAGVSREYQEKSLAEQGATIIRECAADGKCGEGGNPWTLARVVGALAGKRATVESISTESMDGKLAVVAVKVKPAEGDAQFVECKMRERDGKWQLVEFVNQSKLEVASSDLRKAHDAVPK